MKARTSSAARFKRGAALHSASVKARFLGDTQVARQRSATYIAAGALVRAASA